MRTAETFIHEHKLERSCVFLLLFVLLALCGVSWVRAGDASTAAAAGTNAMATMTNAMAAATNAPAPPQQPDSVAYPPGANAGNEQDFTWPVPAKTMDNLGMTNAPTPLY